jgi:hypothetical protein
LICIFLSIFLLPVWRRIEEWLAMQKVYDRYIRAASGISHPHSVSQTWLRVDSLPSPEKFNSRSNLFVETDECELYDDDTAYQIREMEEHGGVIEECKFGISRSRKNSSEQQGVELSIVKSDQTDVHL